MLATLLMGCTTASLADCSDRPRDRPDLDAAGVGRYGTRSPAGGHPGRAPAPRCSNACRAVARVSSSRLPDTSPSPCCSTSSTTASIGDATSREANAYYVFFSNDPHLAAIGFVWNPLTSLTEMPLILLKGIWPALTAEAFASGIMSSVFMAGTCYQLFRFMEELGVRRTVRWLLVAAFAVNPMIVFSGGNGMSEALFLFTLVATTRYLARWLAGARTRDLIVAGIWLGLAYADRNEAAMAALVSVARSTDSFLPAVGRLGPPTTTCGSDRCRAVCCPLRPQFPWLGRGELDHRRPPFRTVLLRLRHQFTAANFERRPGRPHSGITRCRRPSG